MAGNGWKILLALGGLTLSGFQFPVSMAIEDSIHGHSVPLRPTPGRRPEGTAGVESKGRVRWQQVASASEGALTYPDHSPRIQDPFSLRGHLGPVPTQGPLGTSLRPPGR